MFRVRRTVFDLHTRFSMSIYRFTMPIYGFSTPPIQVFELEHDPQKSKIGFDHLNLDVWRLRKPVLRSKVVEI